MEAFDNELHDYLESLEDKHECSECGTPIEENQTYCSSDCFKASLL